MWLAQLPLTLSVMGSIPAAAYFFPSEFSVQILFGVNMIKEMLS